MNYPIIRNQCLKCNVILNGDALTHLKELPSESINCVMTSPPYWALRDYGVEGQIGLEPTFDLYINNLCNIFDEVKRVLRKDGTCWVNIGDTYYGSGKGVGGDLEDSKETYQMPKGWNRPSRDAFKERGINKKCLFCGKEIQTGTNGQFCNRECLNKMGNDFRTQNRILPDKTLCNIPARFSIEMQNRGWILRNVIIWHKPNCMPSSVKDRFTVDFEYLFFFVKNKKYWFETQYEPHRSSNNQPEFLAKEFEGKENNMRVSHGGNRNPDFLNSQGRNKRAVWTITTKPFKEAHFATYPEELCETPIKSGCPPGGIVLDPFFGAGTTGLVALKLNRKFIGIELNPEYIKIANERLKPYLEQEKLI